MFQRLRRLSIDLTSVRQSRPFRQLILGHTISSVGNNVTLLALFWQVQVLTDSTLAVGLVGVAYAVPMVLFSLWGGVLADAGDRKRLLVGTQLGLLVVAGALAALAVVEPPVWSLYLLTVCSSILHAIENPTRTAAIPALVTEATLKSAIQLREMAIQGSRLVGPMLAGIVIDGAGLAWAYGFDAAVSLIAAICFLRLPALVPEQTSGRSWAALREGWAYLRNQRVLRATFYADLVAMILGMPRAVFPAMALAFGVGATGLGAMTAAIGAGGVVGVLLSGWTTRVEREGLAVLVSVSAFGAAIAVFGVVDSFAVGLAMLALAGWADMISAVFRQSMLLQITPDHLRGRMGAVHSMVVTGGPPLGDFESGAAAEILGLRPSIVLGGLGCMVGIGAIAWRQPAFVRWHTPGP